MSSRIDALRDAFHDDPSSDSSFLALFRALVDSRDLESLVEVYRVRASVVDPEQAIYLYLTVAEVWSNRLGMPGLASESLFAAYELDPDSRALRERLRAHLDAQRDWTMMARLLDHEARRAESNLERGRALLTFGHFLQEKLHDIGEAARMYLKAADACAETYTAAVIALQRLKRSEPNSAEVARALHSLLGHGPNPDKTIRALETELERTPAADHGARIDLLVQLARMQLEGIGDTMRAFELLDEALTFGPDASARVREVLWTIVDAAPGFVEALRRLRALELELGDAHAAVELAHRELELQARPAERAELLIELARLYADTLDQPHQAIEAVMDAHRLDPSRRQQVRGEVHRLLAANPLDEHVRNAMIDLLESAGDSDGLARLWDSVADAAPDAPQRAEALWRKGRVQLELGRSPHAALRTWLLAAVAGEPGREPLAGIGSRVVVDIVDLYEVVELRNEVVAAVKELAPALGRHDVLCDLLSRHADHQVDPRARARTLRELGEVLDVALGQPARALAAYRAAFRTCPDDLEVVTALRRTYGQLGDDDQARGLLEIELRLTDDPAERTRLHGERARLERRLGDPRAVLSSYAELLRLSPDDPEARAAVLELFDGDEGQQALETVLEGSIDAHEGTSALHVGHLRAVAAVLAEADAVAARETAATLYLTALRVRSDRFTADELDRLEALLESLDRHTDLADLLRVRALERPATASDDTADAEPSDGTVVGVAPAAALARLQALADRRPEDDAIQSRLARARLELEPTEAGFDALVALHERAGDQAAIAELVLWSADHAPWIARRGIEARIETMHRAGELIRETLDDARRYESLMRRVLDLDRNDDRALDFFRDHLADDPLAFYQLLAPSAPAAQTPQTRAERQTELATLSQEAIGDLDRAIFHWNQVLGLDDAPGEARERAYLALREIYLQRDSQDALIELVRSQANAAETPEARIDYLWELVRLQREVRRDVPSARRTLQRILRIDADEPRALASLADLDLDAGDVDTAVGHLHHLVEVTTDRQQRRHRLRLTRLLAEQRNDWRGALEVLREELADRPGDERSLRELGRLLLDDEHEVDARLAAWSEIVADQIEHVDDPALAVELERNRARVLGRAGDVWLEDALTAWQRVLTERPTDLEAIESMGALLSQAERWREAAAHLHECGERLALASEPIDAARDVDADGTPQSSPADAAAGLFVRLAEVQATGLHDSAAAHAALDRALELDSGSVAALDWRLRLAREDGEHERQLQTLDLLAAVLPVEDRARVWLEKAAVHEGLDQLDEATRALESYVAADPLDEAALVRLQSLYQRQNRLDGLAEVLGRLAGLASDEDRRRALLLEQARIFELELEDPVAALRIHERLLGEAPRLLESLEATARIHREVGRHEEALSALESMIRAAPSERRVDLVMQTADLFETLEQDDEAFARYRWAHELAGEGEERPMVSMWRLARRAELWPDLVEVLEQDAMRTDDPQLQMRLLREVAELTEHQLGDAHRAFHVLRMAQQLEPSSVELLAELERVAVANEFWLDLAVVYRGLSDIAEDADTHVGYMHQVADVTAQHMGNAPGAFDVLLEILDEYPEHEATLQRLLSLTESHGLWSMYLDFLDERVEALDRVGAAAAPARRRQLLLEAAAICRDRLDDPDGALARLLTALEMMPTDAELIEAIGELSAPELDPWPRALEVLERSVQHAEGSERVVAAALLRARILDGRRNEPEAAFDALLEALEVSTDERLLTTIEQLGRRVGRLGEAADVIEARLDDTLERNAALTLLEVRVRLLEAAGQLPQALVAVRRLLELDPTHAAANARLQHLTADDDRIHELLRSLETQAERLQDPAQRAAKRVELAALLESRDRLVEAADVYDKVLRDTPQDLQARRRLIWISERLGRWPQVASGLEALLDRQLEPAHARDDVFALAEVRARRLNQVDAAVAVLRKHIDQAPDDQQAEDTLEALLRQHERWSELMAACERRSRTAPDADERRRCLFESAALAIDQFQNIPRGLRALEQLADDEDSARDPRVLGRLFELYRSLDRHGDATRIARRWIDALTADDAQRANALWQLAMVQAEGLGDQVAAIETLGELVTQNPEYAEGWRRRGELLVALGRHEEAREAWVEATEHLDAPAAATLWLQIGRLLHDHLDSPDLAADAFERTLSLAPDNTEAIAELRRLARESDDPERQTAALELALAQAPDGAARARLLWQRAVLERDALEHYTEAERTLVAALEAWPEHYASRRDLADLRFARGVWTQAADAYRELAAGRYRRAGSDEELRFPPARLTHYLRPDDSDKLVFQLRLAICLEKLDDYHDAVRIYRKAHDRHRDHTAVRVGLCRCYYRIGNWARARRHLEKLVPHVRTLGLTARDQAQLRYYLGDILAAGKQLDEALLHLDDALDASPNYRPAADQKLGVLIESKRWPETVPAFYHLLRLTDDDAERGAIFKRLGEVHEYFLDQPLDAVAAYEQAMLHGGEDTWDVPERLLRLYVTHELWLKAEVTARALVEQTPDGSARQIEYLIVLGDILSRGLGQLDVALETYHRAYALAPTDLLALERVAAVHALRGDIDAMADVYSDHLARLDADDPRARADVLARYGAQLIDACDAPREAIAVYQNLATLEPDDTAVHRKLAELFAHPSVAAPQLELEHLRTLVALGDARRRDLLRILDLYEQLDETVGRDAMVSFIRFVDGEDPEGRRSIRLAPGTIAGEDYDRFVLDRNAAGPLGRLFDRLSTLGLDELGPDLDVIGVSGLEDLTRRPQTPAVGVFRELCKAMSLGPRQLYVQRGDDVPFRVVASSPPAIVVSHDVLSSLVGQELRFFLAMALELTRPRFLLASSIGAFEMLTVMRTLFSELSRSRTPPARPSLVERRVQDQLRKFLRGLRGRHSVEVQEDLESLADEVLREADGQIPSAKRYVLAARSTAIRVGLLAAGSQTAALKRLLKQERGTALYRPRDFDDYLELMSASPDLQALTTYLVSDEYLAAQRAIGRTTAEQQEAAAELREGTDPELVVVDAEPIDASLEEATRELSPSPMLDAVGQVGGGFGSDLLDGLEDLAAEALAALDSATEVLATHTAPVDRELVEHDDFESLPERDDAQTAEALTSADQAAASVDGAGVVPSDAGNGEAFDPDVGRNDDRVRPSISLEAEDIEAMLGEFDSFGTLPVVELDDDDDDDEPLDDEPPHTKDSAVVSASSDVLQTWDGDATDDDAGGRVPASGVLPMPPPSSTLSGPPPAPHSAPPRTAPPPPPPAQPPTRVETGISEVIELDELDIHELDVEVLADDDVQIVDERDVSLPPPLDAQAAARVLSGAGILKRKGRSLNAPTTSMQARIDDSSGILPIVSVADDDEDDPEKPS